MTSEREVKEVAASCRRIANFDTPHDPRKALREAAALIERLADERDEALANEARWLRGHNIVVKSKISERMKYQALLDEAGAALEPLAQAAMSLDSFTNPDPDTRQWPSDVRMPTVRHLRTARAVYDKLKGGAR